MGKKCISGIFEGAAPYNVREETKEKHIIFRRLDLEVLGYVTA
jgi:hypothetical protein